MAKIVLDEKPRFVNTQARRNVYSLQRAQGYNKSKIQIFEQVLENELFDENGMRRITAENIFNVDETGVCVNQKPHTILAKKGKKSISVIQSAEKGKTILAHAKVITAYPYKRKLEEAFTEKNLKMDAKKKRLEKRIEKALEKTSTIEGGKPSLKKQSNPKKAKNPASIKKVKSKSPASDAN